MQRWLAVMTAAGLTLAAGAAQAQDRSLEITEFYVYPDNTASFNKLDGYRWPDVQELNALVRVMLGGFSGEERLDLFLAIQDADEPDGPVIGKSKLKFYLPAGEHDCVFPEIINTGDYFGERSYKLTVEAALKGVKPLYDEFYFSVTGPDPPAVDILDVDIFNPEVGANTGYYSPGDEFAVEALIEIEDNDSDIQPTIIFFAMMEEDAHLIDPELSYQPYDRHWASRPLGDTEGVFEIRAYGHLPYFFYDSYAFSHDFRVYAIVDFGPGAVTSDYARSELWDYNAGEQRYSEELIDRLIELDRGHLWSVRRMRGAKPESDDRFWDR